MPDERDVNELLNDLHAMPFELIEHRLMEAAEAPAVFGGPEYVRRELYLAEYLRRLAVGKEVHDANL